MFESVYIRSDIYLVLSKGTYLPDANTTPNKADTDVYRRDGKRILQPCTHRRRLTPPGPLSPMEGHLARHVSRSFAGRLSAKKQRDAHVRKSPDK
jgi:hypothetical protein